MGARSESEVTGLPFSVSFRRAALTFAANMPIRSRMSPAPANLRVSGT